jgi:hypothetical protein
VEVLGVLLGFVVAIIIGNLNRGEVWILLIGLLVTVIRVVIWTARRCWGHCRRGTRGEELPIDR